MQAPSLLPVQNLHPFVSTQSSPSPDATSCDSVHQTIHLRVDLPMSYRPVQEQQALAQVTGSSLG